MDTSLPLGGGVTYEHARELLSPKHMICSPWEAMGYFEFEAALRTWPSQRARSLVWNEPLLAERASTDAPPPTWDRAETSHPQPPAYQSRRITFLAFSASSRACTFVPSLLISDYPVGACDRGKRIVTF